MSVRVHMFPKMAGEFTVLLKKTKLPIISWLSLCMPKLADCPCGWMAHTGDSRLRRHVGKVRVFLVGFFLRACHPVNTIRFIGPELCQMFLNPTVLLQGARKCNILSHLFYLIYILITYHMNHSKM